MAEEAERVQDEADFDAQHTATAVKEKPVPVRVDRMPPWKVLLHNDDLNTVEDVIEAIVELTTLTDMEAIERTLEAHSRGLSLILVTHREHAELLQEQFTTKCLTVTIEPD